MRRMGEHDLAAKDPLLMTEAEAYEYYAPDTAFVIDLSLVGTNEFSITPASMGTSLNHAVVDWGDGTKEEWDAWFWGTKRTHTYATQGRYVIRIRGVDRPSYDFSSTLRPAIIRALRFADAADCGIFDFSSCKNLTAFPEGKLARWPSDAKEIGEVYRCCTSLAATELPDWPEGVTTIRDVYGDCTAFNLTKIPEWPSTLEWLDMGGNGSTGLYGNMPNLRLTTLPKWPKSLKKITAYNWNGVFRGCPNVTAEPPEWPEGLEEATSVYNCGTKVSGRIPAWPDGLTSANGTFSSCTGLTGDIPKWPDGLTSANDTFSSCTGLTGEIPKWPDGLTSANWTYQYCGNLTGAWTSDPAELMPTNITSHSGCVRGANTALRALFYSDWGGTRTKEETTTT